MNVEEVGEGLKIKVRVQTRASKNKVVGTYGGMLKIKITAPPVEGAANRECEKFLASLLGIPRSSVSIASGMKSRNKTVLLKGLTVQELEELMASVTL